jgi:hypothetical protein
LNNSKYQINRSAGISDHYFGRPLACSRQYSGGAHGTNDFAGTEAHPKLEGNIVARGMQVTEVRRHVLIWVAPEFLKSTGMIQLFTEAGIFLPPEGELDEYIRSAEAAGGFAMTGRLVESGHGAGIWISPVNVAGLGLMVPWHYIKSVVTAEGQQSARIFGLVTDLAEPDSAKQQTNGRKKTRNIVK